MKRLCANFYFDTGLSGRMLPKSHFYTYKKWNMARFIDFVLRKAKKFTKIGGQEQAEPILKDAAKRPRIYKRGVESRRFEDPSEASPGLKLSY